MAVPVQRGKNSEGRGDVGIKIRRGPPLLRKSAVQYGQNLTALISLAASQVYYVEARMTEGVNGDHLTVRWQLPGGSVEEPIAVEHLRPWGYPFESTEPPVLRIVLGGQGSGAEFGLEWEGSGMLLEAPTVNGPWEMTDATSPFPVEPAEARKFYRIRRQ